MGYSRLFVILLLSSYSLAQDRGDDNDQTSTCRVASRFKTHRKYFYQYTAESRNGVVGTTNLRNGPKVSCQVEIEVPQACRFIMHARECALSEVSATDPQGQPEYSQAARSDAFKDAMENSPLKFTVDDVTGVELFPETDEPVNILNIKRGIVSALMVPLLEDDQIRPMSTVHGQCATNYQVNTRRDIATDVTLSRDLSKCDQFYSRELVNSPLALIQKLHRPMSKLISSTQACNYQFDNKGKHVTSAMCTEKHIYIPFSNEDNGLSSVVTQELRFKNSRKLDNRAFDVNFSESKPLYFEDPDDKASVQTKEAVLSTLRDLANLPGTDQGQKRTSLFHKLVSGLRLLKNETLSLTVIEMMEVSGWLTWQALFQCGSPECTSAILQSIWTFDGASLEVDALVYGVSLQANPDAARVQDMLSMAQFKQSRAIMYALANTVKKFHSGEVTPVVTDVAKFMETLLNDCSGEIRDTDTDFPADPEELSFLVLKVVGVMGQAMQDVSPSLIASILRCATKTDIPLLNQKAAIQAFRLMDINREVRPVFEKMYMDSGEPVEKRVAAYLMLMKNPDDKLIRDVVTSLEIIEDQELKQFVISHLINIHKSSKPEMEQVKEYIDWALNDPQSPTNKENDGMSKNYKIESSLGSVQGNVIFDNTNTLPKEVMLETTLKVFDYDYEIFEVGVEGTGFEPTIDALFGENGFFPDSISKVLYWAAAKAEALKDTLGKDRDRMKRQVPEDLLTEIISSVRKLLDQVRSSKTPESVAYLRLLGTEIGYMKPSDMKKMAETLFMYYHVFGRVLPFNAFLALTSSTENEVFAHYIFMENAFSLPTASGFPLKFSLAGVFAPGAKGGLSHSRATGMTELSFMPSVGLEFITQMGVHIPDYVEAGYEMHNEMYHESSLNAKVTMNRNQIRLSIPAPDSNTQLLSFSNKLLSVSSGETTMVPPLVEDRTDTSDCQPLISGLNLCTITQYNHATATDQAPYFPLTGDARIAVEIQPTGTVSEYTATITQEKLREGKKGRKVDSLKLTLKAEGDDSTEATATLKYNHNKNTYTTDVVIPDFNVEAGIKLAVTDSEAKGKKMRGITIDVSNKNIPQLSLIASTRLDRMKDAMLQLQLVIPSLNSDASVTASLKKYEGTIMELETAINLPETSSQQKATLKYDDDKLELELKSDLNSEIQKLIPNIEDIHRQLQQFIDHMLDQKVAKTDMKLRHIVTKVIEAVNIWMGKLSEHFPYLENLRRKRSISDLTLPALPEKLFLQIDSLFRYQFNKDSLALSLPLPYGGKKSEELNIPTTLSIPPINLPDIGLDVPAKEISLPSFTIPPSLDFTVPLLGLAEASTKINSNFYSWEGSVSGGNNTLDVPSFIGQYKAKAQSPFNLLSYELEGSGMMSGKPDESLKYLLNNSFSHSLIETSFSVVETVEMTDKMNARANYKIEAISPLGLHYTLLYSAQATSHLDTEEIYGDGTVDGSLKIGSFNARTSYINSYNLSPAKGEGEGESSLHLILPFIEVHNRIQGLYKNSELKIVSNTKALDDILKHEAELKYKNSQLTLKCNGMVKGMGKSLNNKVELGVSSDMGILRIESQADDDKNMAYSLLTGSLDSNGLQLNSEASLTSDIGRGLHKATVMINGNGLTTSGTNSIQCSPITFENIFEGAISNNGVTMSSMTKAMAEESRGELSIEGKITAEEASLDGVLKGHAYDASTKNNVNVFVNRRGLTFTSEINGRMKEMNTENSHSLTLTLWTLNLHSKTNNFICEDVYYKHDLTVDMKPFVLSFDTINNLKFYDASLDNEGHMKLEPIKVDLSGSLSGAYGEDDNIKHTYELSYDNLAGAIKHSTSGNTMDAQLSSKCEIEFAGLSSTSICEARINSDPLRFDSTIRTMAVPFSLTVDAIVNSDGEIKLHGKHTGQLYSKFLVKIGPLVFAQSHENRVSTTHKLPSGLSSTSLENKLDVFLSPSDQGLAWLFNSKLNDHSYEQKISAYNNPEENGLTFSGELLTDIFSKLNRQKRSADELKKFSASGFLKYDKSSSCHIIEIPFIESLPAAFEELKNILVHALESIQRKINTLDIDQLIVDLRAKLEQLPTQVRDLIQQMDLENKVNQVKAQLDYLIDEFAITLDDLEVAMDNLKNNLENKLMDIVHDVKGLVQRAIDYIQDGHLADKITDVLSQIENWLQVLDDEYKIKESLIKVLNAIEDIISQIDLQKLSENSATWLEELDSKYGVLEKIKDKLSEIKQFIENFDVNMFFEDVKNYILSIDFADYAEQLKSKISSLEIPKVIDLMNDVIVNWIDEYDIPNKLNAVYSYIRDLLLKYKLDDKFKALMDQILILIEDFKIDETVQSMVNALRSINFESAYENIIQFLQDVTSKLREMDFKEIIDDLNERISSTLKFMSNFDYNAFVDEINMKIAELTDYINEQIKIYEIVEKIEAVREFFKEIQTSIHTYLEGLKNTKVADTLRKLKEVLDTTFYNDIKMKIKDMLEDMRQRVLDMDIINEMYIHLQRASESYTNIVAFISAQLEQLMEKIMKLAEDNDAINQIKQAVETVLAALKKAEIEVPAFTVPLTDLVIPAFTINLNKLQDISIPAQISIPEFTILDTYTFSGFTIDLNEIKENIVAIIEDIRDFEIQMPDPEEIFGDLKVLYLSDLPDLTFPEIRLSEIKFPTITIPTLNLNEFEITMIQVPGIKMPEIPSDICIPAFGKIHGEFIVSSPFYNLLTIGKIENSTTTPQNPQFTATITSEGRSSIEPLEYTFEATALLEAPRMRELQFTEKMKLTHMAFSIDHEGSLMLAGLSAEAMAKTISKATTDIYSAELVNSLTLTLNRGISASVDTTYNHVIGIPSAEIVSQAFMKQNILATVESRTVTITGETTGNGKWSIKDYDDEGSYKSNAEFTVDLNTAKLTFTEETDFKALKSKKTVTAEAVILSHITVEARCEAESVHVKKSIMSLDGAAHLGDLKVELTAFHDAEFREGMHGTMTNSLEFKAHPFEIELDAKNKVNTKIFFPLDLTGKVDLQNDYCLTLNSEKQRACWFASARFNQYKYNSNITAENNEKDIFLHSSASGEANLDFLTVPLSIPQIHIYYLDIVTPEVRDLSLWEHLGLKTLLTTPQQSFDMNLKLNYHKGPEWHSYDLHLEPIYNAISDSANLIQDEFEHQIGKLVRKLKDSYNEAKSQYMKHKVRSASTPPRIFTVPGYTIPILDIKVSAFSAEMPAFNYFVPREVSTPSFKVPALGFSVPSYTLVLPSLELPVIHVPESLTELKLPTFRLPAIQNKIMIPSFGDMTCDFSFKSNVITLNANAGVYAQPDIVARFSAISTSVFDILNGKIDGTTTSLIKERGFKLATTVTLQHDNVESSHECAFSVMNRTIEASVSNSANIRLPFLSLEIKQELNGNSYTKPIVSSTKMIKYMFNIPLIESVGEGNLNMNWALEALSSYMSLESNTQGMSEITILDCTFAGKLGNEATFYLNGNGLRSTIKNSLQSSIAKQEKQKRSVNNNIYYFDLIENLALELSSQRLFAKFDYESNNNVDLGSFSTNGRHIIKGELDFDHSAIKTTFNIDANQPSTLADAGFSHNINLGITPDKQSFTWSVKEQLASLIHSCDFLVSNDETEVLMSVTCSVEGHLDFLKSVKLPAYQKTLWDVLKFDQVTNIDDLQFLRISSTIVYTKSSQGYEFSLPFAIYQDGITFKIPEIHITVPSWAKDIPNSLNSINMQFETPDVPDYLTFPPVIRVPAFIVPFTNLHVNSFRIDPKNLHVPKVITTTAFDIMLPGLPFISVPSYDINTEYVQGKMPFLSFKVPQHRITSSSFTLPKSLTLGDYTLNLNDITTQVLNFELPTIFIPKKKFVISRFAIHLPVGVFLPAFGALKAAVKVSSPIYNVSTVVDLDRRDSTLTTQLHSICTSTMIFLEYDLFASALMGFSNGLFNLEGKCNLIHSDVSVKWNHALTQNQRMKRQASQDDSMTSLHTLNVDIASPTFADVNFRFASRKDGVTASMSSPSAGYLGLHLQRRSPSQLYGKLFSRYTSSPGKDTDVLTAKATLKNSEKLTLQMSWNWDFLHDFIEGTKERIPAMTDAVLKFINKYHVAHFGFDLNRGCIKLKNTASNLIEKVYHEVRLSFNTLQSSIQQLGDQVKDTYMKMSDSLMSFNVQDAKDNLIHEVNQIKNPIEKKIMDLWDGVTQLSFSVAFSVPGSEEKVSALELFDRARQSVSRAIDRASQRLARLVDIIVGYIRDIEFTVPGTEVIVNGNDIMDKLISFPDTLVKSIRKWLEFLYKEAENHIQAIVEKVSDLITDMDMASLVDAIQKQLLPALKQQIEEAKARAVEYKDLSKMKIQEACSNINTERVNNGTREVVEILQSHLYGGLNEGVDLLRTMSQNTAPYVRVSNKKVDVEIPLPFLWKSFSEWPTRSKK